MSTTQPQQQRSGQRADPGLIHPEGPAPEDYRKEFAATPTKHLYEGEATITLDKINLLARDAEQVFKVHLLHLTEKLDASHTARFLEGKRKFEKFIAGATNSVIDIDERKATLARAYGLAEEIAKALSELAETGEHLVSKVEYNQLEQTRLKCSRVKQLITSHIGPTRSEPRDEGVVAPSKDSLKTIEGALTNISNRIAKIPDSEVAEWTQLAKNLAQAQFKLQIARDETVSPLERRVVGSLAAKQAVAIINRFVDSQHKAASYLDRNDMEALVDAITPLESATKELDPYNKASK